MMAKGRAMKGRARKTSSARTTTKPRPQKQGPIYVIVYPNGSISRTFGKIAAARTFNRRASTKGEVRKVR